VSDERRGGQIRIGHIILGLIGVSGSGGIVGSIIDKDVVDATQIPLLQSLLMIADKNPIIAGMLVMGVLLGFWWMGKTGIRLRFKSNGNGAVIAFEQDEPEQPPDPTQVVTSMPDADHAFVVSETLLLSALDKSVQAAVKSQINGDLSSIRLKLNDHDITLTNIGTDVKQTRDLLDRLMIKMI
jgi:hypothetical protein